jgi:hypothetical protein
VANGKGADCGRVSRENGDAAAPIGPKLENAGTERDVITRDDF